MSCRPPSCMCAACKGALYPSPAGGGTRAENGGGCSLAPKSYGRGRPWVSRVVGREGTFDGGGATVAPRAPQSWSCAAGPESVGRGGRHLPAGAGDGCAAWRVDPTRRRIEYGGLAEVAYQRNESGT